MYPLTQDACTASLRVCIGYPYIGYTYTLLVYMDVHRVCVVVWTLRRMRGIRYRYPLHPMRMNPLAELDASLRTPYPLTVYLPIYPYLPSKG